MKEKLIMYRITPPPKENETPLWEAGERKPSAASMISEGPTPAEILDKPLSKDTTAITEKITQIKPVSSTIVPQETQNDEPIRTLELSPPLKISPQTELTPKEAIMAHKDRILFARPTESYHTDAPKIGWKAKQSEVRNFQREIRIREEGSPIRALASALKAAPTNNEWQSLFEHIDSNREYAKALNAKEKNANHKEINAQVIENNERHMQNLLIEYAGNNSAFGDKLRRSQVSFRESQTPDQLKEMINDGKKVIISTDIPGKGRHMINVGIEKTGKYKGEFIALSEKGRPVVKTDKEGRYTTISITPPKEDPKILKKAERKQQIVDSLKNIPSKKSSDYKDYTITY